MINYITSPFKWFFKLEAASGLLLLITAVIALIISNSNLNDYYFDTLNAHILVGSKNFGLDLSVQHWVNDVLMAVFFFVVTVFSFSNTALNNTTVFERVEPILTELP